MTVLDLQTIRYINLLDNTARVKTRKCFNYNNAIIFAVPQHMIMKAVGPNARNIRFIQEKLGKIRLFLFLLLYPPTPTASIPAKINLPIINLERWKEKITSP